MKEKIIIYPFDVEQTYLLRYQNLLQGRTIEGVVSPGGWGITGEDAGELEGGEVLNIKVSKDFNSSLVNCDGVLFCESCNTVNFDEMIYPKMLKCIELKKKILCSIQLEDAIESQIRHLCDESNVVFEYYGRSEDYIDIKQINNLEEHINKINTPVVLVLGLGNRCNKTNIQLGLFEKYKSMGYKISMVSSKHCGKLIGAYSFPKFMNDNRLSEEEKVIAFNKFVKAIEEKDAPDLIIIAAPGGIMPLSDMFPARFGLKAYEIACAVKPDFTVMSMYYGEFKQEYLQEMGKAVKYKLGFPVDCFFISNSRVDWMMSKTENCLQYVTLDSKFIEKKKSEFSDFNIPICNTFNDKDREFIAEYIVDKLSEYANIS